MLRMWKQTHNNTLERTMIDRGRLVLAIDRALGKAQQRLWPAAQLGR
jgi:hypothetical protein